VGSSSVEARIDRFIARYSDEIARQLRAARAKLHERFPRGHELVYDNYNALVFAFSPSERASDIVVSIAGYPRWVTLFFLHGASLPDPKKVLEGSGKQVRGLRLERADDLEAPTTRALIAAAIKPAAAAFKAAPARTASIKSAVRKQRDRRPRVRRPA